MKQSEIIAAAAEAAVRAARDQNHNVQSELSAAEWEAMYVAQCEATDEWAKRW